MEKRKKTSEKDKKNNKVSKIVETKNTCGICHEDVTKFNLFDCGHVLCNNCAEFHLRLNDFCPQCRQTLEKKDYQITDGEKLKTVDRKHICGSCKGIKKTCKNCYFIMKYARLNFFNDVENENKSFCYCEIDKLLCKPCKCAVKFYENSIEEEGRENDQHALFSLLNDGEESLEDDIDDNSLIRETIRQISHEIPIFFSFIDQR